MRVPRVPLARPDPNRIRIRRRDRHGPDALRRLLIEERFPSQSRTLAPPQPPARRAGVNHFRPIALDRYRRHPAAHRARPHVPNRHALQEGLHVLRRRQQGCCQEGEENALLHLVSPICSTARTGTVTGMPHALPVTVPSARSSTSPPVKKFINSFFKIAAMAPGSLATSSEIVDSA